MTEKFLAACVQMNSGPEIAANIAIAADFIRQAAARGAQLILTPENTSLIEPNKKAALAKTPAENAHPGLAAFADLARDLKIWLIVGSMPVRVEETRIANRCFAFSPAGRPVARYDKIHMFDVDLPTGERHRESAQVRPGGDAVLMPSPWGQIGLTICYDLRFPHLHRMLAKAGARLLTVPAAFTVPTGEAHWHVLLRARAIETGCFVLAAAQTGEHAGGRRTFGHSLIVDPWGKVLEDAGKDVGIILTEIDMTRVEKARAAIPALTHDRDFKLPEPNLRAASE